VGGEVNSSGRVKIKNFGKEPGRVKIGGKIDCSGGCVIEGNLVLE